VRRLVLSFLISLRASRAARERIPPAQPLGSIFEPSRSVGNDLAAKPTMTGKSGEIARVKQRADCDAERCEVGKSLTKTLEPRAAAANGSPARSIVLNGNIPHRTFW
jgi:hypothetical protein